MSDPAPLPEQVRVLIVRFSYDGNERGEIGTWLAGTTLTLSAHPRVQDVCNSFMVGYPITAQRNQALLQARKNGFHYVVFCDTDMMFDAHTGESGLFYAATPKIEGQVAFLPSALDFALTHHGPCVIAAPYCSGPPTERVLVHKFVETESQNQNYPRAGMALEAFSREEAARRTGFEIVAALPTGLMLIDTRVVDVMGPPWFYYEYKDDLQTQLASTEDVTFSRNLFYLGVPQYVAWDSWAAHVKHTIVGKPRVYPQNAYPRAIKAQLENEVLARAKETRPADRVNAVAVQLLKERAAMKAMEEDADPVTPDPGS